MAAAERRVRFGVVNEVIPGRGGWPDHVRRAEDSGADTLLIRDHIAPGPFGPQLAPLSAAAAMAACTTRLRVGTMVLSNDYRHPALVAHEAATIDWLSGGRLELGLGAGWLRGEYRQMGMAFEPAGTRITRLEEAIAPSGCAATARRPRKSPLRRPSWAASRREMRPCYFEY